MAPTRICWSSGNGRPRGPRRKRARPWGDGDEKKVQAAFKDGMLNVHLGKSEAAKPKTIEVEVA